MSRPVVLPDAFNGEGSFIDWIDHFERVASLNKWSDDDKLLWLRICLTGQAQTAYKQLKGEVCRGTYDNTLSQIVGRSSVQWSFKPCERIRRRAGPILEMICAP